jgi:hypothetical protein
MAMKIGPGFKRLEERFTDAELLPAVESAMEEAMNAGKQRILEVIDTSGTSGPWPDPFPKIWRNSGNKTQPDGSRNDTGKMRDNIDSRVLISGRGTVRGELGWLKGTEEYFLAQEYGFYHNMTGNWITGMFAFREGKEVAADVFYDRVGRAIEEQFSK